MQPYFFNRLIMGFFDQAKDLYKLQKQAKQIKEELKNIHVESETDGLKLVINAEQTFLEVTVSPKLLMDAKKLGKAFVDAANKAVKKAQAIGAEKMKAVMGSGGAGGLFGK